MKKEMATHSSIFAWEIPQIEEPGGLQSVELQRIRYDLETKQRQRVYMTLYFILQKVFWSCGHTSGDSGEESVALLTKAVLSAWEIYINTVT